MEEWIGGIIAFWPVWAVALVVVVVCVVWFLYFFTTSITDFPFRKKEWWQDRHKRFEKQATVRQRKQAKKG